MRIRTIKPEFWQHEGLAKLPDFVRLTALALLNYADDDGYFLASPQLIRGNIFPFEEDSSKIRRALVELSNAGWIECGVGDDGREVARVVNFRKHQRIDRPQSSKLKGSMRFVEDSSNDQRGFVEPSLWEQGTGNRDQGTRNGVSPSVPQGGSQEANLLPAPIESVKESEPVDPKPAPKPKKKRGAGADELALPESWSEEKRRALEEWLAYKREQFRQIYKPMGLRKLVQSLESRSAKELQEAVDLAMAKTWKGLVFAEDRSFQSATPQKKEGGPGAMASSEGRSCPEGFDRACEAIFGYVPGAWATLSDATQAEILDWLEKKEGGATE